ncbi:MAG: type II secretion system protein [Dehalococcoidia bacterium]|nr:MAG: type II secretion system protein [Dehalococcoidia bacterium]
MKRLIKKFNGNQRGFTLLETTVTMAISSIIIVGLVISINQIMFQGSEVRADMESTQFVQNSGSWLRQDILMSQSILPGDNPATDENETMTLYWTSASYKDTQDNDCIDYYEVSFYLIGEELRRKEQVTTNVYNPNGGLIETLENQGVSLISDSIIEFTLNSENNSQILSIVALVGDSRTEKTYEIFPRALDR